MSGRKKREESAPPGIVVLYTSLMILMLAFFIMLNSLGETEESKVQEAYKSLMQTFGFQEGGITPFRTEAMGGSPAAFQPMNPVDEDYQVMRGLIFENRLDNNVRMLRSKGMRTVVISGDMLFKQGSTEINPNMTPFLDELAAVIKGRTYPISIYGHTDDEPWHGPNGQDNWTLSAARAVNVLSYLVKQGISPKRLAAFGMAGYDPIEPNTTKQGRRLNNRVSLVFNAKDASQHMLTGSEPERKLDFRGFEFDLMKQPSEQPEQE